MIGLLLIALSWGLLRLEGRGLDALGFDQPRRRSLELLSMFAILAAAVGIQQLSFAGLYGFSWQLNPKISGVGVLNSLRFDVNSVLYEELLFRGYLLYLLLRWMGGGALWISAAAFGVYHWFTFGVFGNPAAMGFVFVFTGAFGFVGALAFRQTGSVAAPIGMHLGWNLITNTVFSNGPLGAGLMIQGNADGAIHGAGIAAGLVSVAWPLAVLAVVGWRLSRKGRVERKNGIETVRTEG
jgi:membrane protease YdiL (CAAX protease family)